jgi:hypothetical protein
MPLEVPLINRNRYDFASIEAMVNGLPVLGRTFKAIEYSDSVQRGVVRAGGRLPLGLTGGEYTAEGSLEMPKEEFDIFLGVITQGGARGYLDAPFEMSVTYAELLGPLMVDHLYGCRINGTSQSHQTGPDGLVVRVPLYIQMLILNGKRPLTGITPTGINL